MSAAGEQQQGPPSPLWPFGDDAQMPASLAHRFGPQLIALLRAADRRSLRAAGRAPRAAVNASMARLRVTTPAGYRSLLAAARERRLPALCELVRDARRAFVHLFDVLLAAPLPGGLGAVTALELHCDCRASGGDGLLTKTVKAMTGQLGALPNLRRLLVAIRVADSPAQAAAVIAAAARCARQEEFSLPSCPFSSGKAIMALRQSLERGAWQQLKVRLGSAQRRPRAEPLANPLCVACLQLCTAG